MKKLDSQEALSLATLLLHWGIAIGFIAMMVFGHIIEDMERSPEKFELLGYHKAAGVLLFWVIILRVIWRLTQGFPKSLVAYPSWQLAASKIVHIALLVGTLVMPISGVLMSIASGRDVHVFGLFTIPGWIEADRDFADLAHEIHGGASKILVVLIAVHIGAALFHHLRLRDGVLLRMLGRKV